MKWFILILTITVVISMCVPATRSALFFAAWRVSADTQYSHGFTAGDGTLIRFKSYGSGSPLVLIHGGLSSSWDWLGVIPDLASRHRVIVVEMRGHGSSALGNLPFTYRLLASDVIAVLDSLEISSADVAGWSDGGNVGLLMALDHPERVRKLVAISANYHPSGVSEAALAPVSENPAVAGSWIGRVLYEFQSDIPEQWPHLQQQVTNMWQSYPQLNPEDLNRISSSTLIIVGENDFIEREHSKIMASAIPNSTLIVFPGVGHAVTRNAPGLLLDEMIKFLSESD